MSESCEDLKRRAIAAADQEALKRRTDWETTQRHDFDETYIAMVAKFPLLTKDDTAMTYEMCGHRFKPSGGCALRPDRSWYALSSLTMVSAYIVNDEASFGRYLLTVAQDDARRAEAAKEHQVYHRRGFWSRLFS